MSKIPILRDRASVAPDRIRVEQGLLGSLMDGGQDGFEVLPEWFSSEVHRNIAHLIHALRREGKPYHETALRCILDGEELGDLIQLRVWSSDHPNWCASEILKARINEVLMGHGKPVAEQEALAVVDGKIRRGEDTPPAIVRSFLDYATATPEPRNSLIGDNWLFRGGWNVLIGPTGQGKTSFQIQRGACNAMGRSCFGLSVSAPLKVLCVQVENDETDLMEVAAGVIEELRPTAEERDLLDRNFKIMTPPKPGIEVFQPGGDVRSELEAWRPDILDLDSLYKWVPGGRVTGEALHEFIDRTLIPLSKRLDFGTFASHHMSRDEAVKLAEGETTEIGDLYAGASGMFLADNTRGALLLVPAGAVGAYSLRAGKRRSRLDWKNADGEPVFTRDLRWANGHIGWNEIAPEQAERERHERDSDTARRKIDKRADQIAWAMDHCKPNEDGWIPQPDILSKAALPGGPIPEGLGDQTARKVIKGAPWRFEYSVEETKRGAGLVRLIG